jgi:hypothetical protein
VLRAPHTAAPAHSAPTAAPARAACRALHARARARSSAPVAAAVLDVDDVVPAAVLLLVHDGAHAPVVVAASDHGQVAQVKLVRERGWCVMV